MDGSTTSQVTAFRAMGSEWRIVQADPDPVRSRRRAIAAMQLVEEVEQALSRFRPDSDLARLERDRVVTGSRHLARCVELALEAHDLTDGAFDITVRDSLEALGYDATFATVAARQPGDPLAVRPALGIDGIDVEVASGRVRLAADIAIDLGGIGKGYAADLVADLVADEVPVLVDAGGDVAARGAGRAEGRWPIALPGRGETGLLVTDAGVATSGTDRRRWRTTRGWRHHVIDPCTGASTCTDLERVTIVAPSLVDADVLATAAIVLGRERACSLLDTLPVEYRFDDAHERMEVTA